MKPLYQQRSLSGRRVQASKLLTLLALLTGLNAGAQVSYPFGFEDNTTGSWAGTASSETVSISNTAANARTGAYSLKMTTTATSTGNKQWYSTTPYLAAANNVYLHFIYWAKGQDAGTSVDASFRYSSTAPPSGSGSSSNASSGMPITNTGWTRITNTTTTSSTRFYYPGPRKTVSTGATAIYVDDGILVASASADVDTVDPGTPTALSGSASGNLITLNWTSATDAGSGATGVMATLILRTSNVNAALPVLNDQGIYSRLGGSAGPNTIGDWTVISDSTSATATTYLDVTAPAGNAKYAVILRDLAYNYSVAAVSPTIVVGTPIPTLLVDTTGYTGNFGTVIRGGQSAEQHYSVRGLNLSGNVTITPPAGFEVSRTSGSGFATSLTLVPASGAVAATNIYVRFSPATASGLTASTIGQSSASAVTKTVPVTGTAIDVEPVSSGTISFGVVRSTRIEVNLPTVGSGNGRIIVIGNGADVSFIPVDGIAPAGVNANYNLAAAQPTGDKIVYSGSGSGSNVVTVTGLTPNTTYYFAVFEYNAGTGSSHNYLPLFPVTAVARTADNDLEAGGVSKTDIRIYPNPATASVHISAPEHTFKTLTDPAGRRLIHTGAAFMDLAGIPTGIYLLTVTDQEGNLLRRERLLKQ